MTASPILKSDLNRIEIVRKALVGARIDAIRYAQTLHGGLSSTPVGVAHEVEIGIEFHLSTGVLFLTWERDDLIEGISIYPSLAIITSDEMVLVSAGKGQQWRDCIGGIVCGLRLMWQVSELGCPESLWSLRLSLDSGRDLVVALGELGDDGAPRYHPDSLVVIFDEVVARSYRQSGAIGTAWNEVVADPG